MRFNKTFSGIVDHKSKEEKHCMKYGGALIFDQEYNGDVTILVVYPHVKDCVDRINDRKIESFTRNYY